MVSHKLRLLNQEVLDNQVDLQITSVCHSVTVYVHKVCNVTLIGVQINDWLNGPHV